MVVGILSYILSLDYGFWKAALGITVLHLLTDMLKSWLLLKNRIKTYFFFDQLIHLLTIVAIVLVYSKIWEIEFIFNIGTKEIGIVERFLALALIIMGQYEAVGLIIAAKSILRFSGTQKSEYILVGTLISFGIAAFAGMLINLI